MDYSYHQTTDEEHGRFEERNYFILNDIDFLNRSKEWTGLSAVGLVESIVTRGEKVTVERRYYITSLKAGAELFGRAVRKHWQVENNLHWVLDVQFGDDMDQKRASNGAENFTVIKRLALNLSKKESSPWKLGKKKIDCDL